MCSYSLPSSEAPLWLSWSPPLYSEVPTAGPRGPRGTRFMAEHLLPAKVSLLPRCHQQLSLAGITVVLPTASPCSLPFLGKGAGIPLQPQGSLPAAPEISSGFDYSWVFPQWDAAVAVPGGCRDTGDSRSQLPVSPRAAACCEAPHRHSVALFSRAPCLVPLGACPHARPRPCCAPPAPRAPCTPHCGPPCTPHSGPPAHPNLVPLYSHPEHPTVVPLYLPFWPLWPLPLQPESCHPQDHTPRMLYSCSEHDEYACI